MGIRAKALGPMGLPPKGSIPKEGKIPERLKNTPWDLEAWERVVSRPRAVSLKGYNTHKGETNTCWVKLLIWLTPCGMAF